MNSFFNCQIYEPKNALSEKVSTHCVQLSTYFIDQFLAGENLTAFMYIVFGLGKYFHNDVD
jgi:hypothetical protein